eukprot:TRINITY_DN54533_c0_g1_i3.p1 TRINITY_DN54533_c0_g1~~TRINITY_DN54533_c0_g1_i3.p1  ORF type:complete len:298 (+),score=48.86 TRINITY_DN54533_c0_g1_i3:34-927(+)
MLRGCMAGARRGAQGQGAGTAVRRVRPRQLAAEPSASSVQFRAAVLRGLGVEMVGASSEDVAGPQGGCLAQKGLQLDGDGGVYLAGNLGLRPEPYRWSRELLARTQSNPVVLNCFGLHEWAMVYRPDHRSAGSARYQDGLRFRLSQSEVNRLVEESQLRCSHLDALRMFSPAAQTRPNRFGSIQALSRDNQPQLEQAACVHAALDLLRWCIKLSPFVRAELLADCLEHALRARRVDVAAGPYDCLEFGIEPIRIETDMGRREYRDLQIELMKEGKPLREQLIREYDLLLSSIADANS